MKASKFTAAQKAFVIKRGEQGSPVEEVCRKAGISQARGTPSPDGEPRRVSPYLQHLRCCCTLKRQRAERPS